MKTRHILSFIAIYAFTFLTSEGLIAAKYRVNNLPQMYANFTNLQTAINTVAAGDTLIVEGSPGSYGSITISKHVVILGPGFFLSENDSTQAFKNSAIMSNMTFNSGSEGTIVSGLYFNNNGPNINANNITIKNCCFIASTSSLIYISSGRSNITIRDNYMENLQGGTTYGIFIDGNVSNLLIYNNIFKNAGYYIILIPSTGSAEIYNNLIINSPLNFQQAILPNHRASR